MACKFYPNISCNCCRNFVKSTAVDLCDDTLVITIPDVDLTNGLYRCICIAQDIPDYTTIPNIAIKVDKCVHPVIQMCSYCLRCVPNNLYADQLRQRCCKMASRQILKVRYAIDTEQWGYCGCCPLCISNGICAPTPPEPPEPTEIKTVKKGGK